ncbi:MAG: tetratricopeptide repeat protein [Pseudodesulfovibrio sp.]|uniref:Tetratricopeptide TPR_2 repeat protein n=1 Tax=Pseudodesulfovibrio aespoeensis (strain ATCC 700646 / DSM 10631 / Aspo-2) TaxID=643562 RepID=E6VR42_PSEA9|nr:MULTISPECIES: tetratricopeptide repeat protein [Pseudodesulfovibrio]MBU4192166.1 tetratricopeptide repeat protein [Pseudomonadota bacterium]ADU64126.1 tetratricopeptide TPR_2 repeat protein [Pseudodesulfovibrio aespoeensis Aspo-2]MBU4245141.1 tetratricopeptide repeat protein [Pseudomonadota bacterium]MBU4379060.1 tetratricopeptide repeat protein [Pseudomonadota bacterium]MBU4474482.1 tetratricopeptide repeat protein [Pseudomonadota bacterium]
MTRTYRPAVLAALSALLLILPLAGLSGCAVVSAPKPVAQERSLSDEARLNYDFLVYQDQLQRLQRHAAEGERSPLTEQEISEISARAEAALDRLLAVSPTPQLYLEKAGLTWNDPAGAAKSREALKTGLKAFPDNQLLTIYLANSYVMDNRVDAAIGVMDDYLAKQPEDYQARERLGQMLMDAGRDAQALDALKKIPADQRSPDALYAMGRAQGNLGMRKAAIATLKKAVAMDETFTEAMVELAYQYELSKDLVAAEKTYARIMDQGDQFPEARLRVINLNLKLNNPGRALDVALNGPQSKSFVLDAVLMFINDGFYAQGSTVLDMLTSDGEVPAEYFFYKAVIANEGENDPKKALTFLDKVNEDDRLYPHALRFKAQLYNALGKGDEALAITRKGKELFPDATTFYILESALLRDKDDKAGAERALREGLARLKDDPELAYELAMLYEASDRRAEGLALMENVLRTHPDHSNGLNYVGYTLAEEDRELDRALVLVQKASLLDPENGYILDSVAWVHYKLKDYPQAWENIGYAVGIVDSDPTIWEHYGDIAKAMGKKSEARKGYRNSLKFKTAHPETIRKKLQEL